ncbi:hypothetical protein MMC24_007445 [Lignoscripta atroalba]|nr:hypothetical protein [Lignoscripta atroalba]
MAIESKKSVIIVGAGPVGLLTALRLGQASIPTLVLESHPTLLPTTRAMVYMPVIIPVLRKLGILDTVQRHAFLNHEGAVWRDIDGNVLGKLPLGGEEKEKKGEFGGVLLIGQARMNSLILEELKKYPSVEVRFGLRCVGIENLPDRESVKVMVHQGSQLDGDLLFEADYVLGTDGANSAVRRILCIPFEGFTWPDWKMIGTDVLYDFPAEMGYTPLTFIVHPNDWAVIAYTGEDADGKPRGAGIPQWRVAYVEPPDLPGSKEEIMKRAYERVATYIKGSKEFKITRAEPYINHQRCAAQAQKGRVLLAGDALHSNNPIGGLGLTSGILDAFCYGNAFTRVVKGGEAPSILTDCAASRLAAWQTATNIASVSNLKRLQSFTEDDIKARDGFFHRLKTDPDFPKLLRKNMDKMIPETFEVKEGAPLATPRHSEDIVRKVELTCS